MVTMRELIEMLPCEVAARGGSIEHSETQHVVLLLRQLSDTYQAVHIAAGGVFCSIVQKGGSSVYVPSAKIKGGSSVPWVPKKKIKLKTPLP